MVPSLQDLIGGGNLQQTVNEIAPLAKSYSGPSANVPVNYQAPFQPHGSALQQFGHFLGGFASGVGNIASGAASWLVKNSVQMAEAPFKFSYDFTKGALDTFTQHNQLNQFAAQQKSLANQYHSGQITAASYQSSLKDIMGQQDKLSKDIQLTGQRLQNSKQEGIDTAAAILTILTGPAGAAIDESIGAGATAKFLSSTSASPFLGNIERGLTKIAADPKAFAALDQTAQKALQTAVAQAVSAGTNLTAAQMTRTAAVNVALKYPIYYNYLSSTGTKLYQELDQKKYGAATRTLAFNAALLLSGGPIGWALKNAGRVVGGASGAVFGKSSFIDALSKSIGPGGDNLNGDAAGLYKAIGSLPEHQRGDVVKQLSAVEATNMSAVGNDAQAAAMRVIKGMESYEGLSMSQFSHEEALNNMVNFAKAQRLADTAGKEAGLGPVAVGRVDARALNEISTAVSTANDSASRLQSWEVLKTQNSTQAWANNENFDRQIKSLISRHEGTAELDNAIKSIKASFSVKGFPDAAATELSKMGYIPIKPVNQEAIFTEGSGKLASKFAQNDNFFTKSVQPLPILGFMGDALTRLGLSPNASSERVYQVFNEQLASNLESTTAYRTIEEKMASQPAIKTAPTNTKSLPEGFSKEEVAFMEKQGITPSTHPDLFKKGEVEGEAQAGANSVPALEKTVPTKPQLSTTDTIIKQLSNYAHNPTHGKLASKLPITDLRMMTTKDVQAALSVSAPDAKNIQRAITQAYIQVPLALRGLGDRAVDRSYQLFGSLQRRYLRVQGAARFSWNPFFQYLRVIPKTETLTEFEGGGFISSVFRGQLGQLRPIRQALREGGFLEQGGFGNVTSGEAVDFEGAISHNLTKKLLPAQENSIAGLVAAQAQRMGMDWKSYIQENPDNIRNTIQMIAEYDKRSNFLNSPLARTLNIAFFPFRFETKVATIMTRSLARTSLMTQISVVNGLLQAHNWLNSAEGQTWYAKNATAIGFFEYISPIATINQVFESLLPGHDHSLGNFGELGGLPFGWLPQLLDAEGLTHFNQPGVNASTGAIYSTYIPNTAKGQMAIGIQDFLGTLFSYPGAAVGLPSKSSITRTAALGVVGGNKKTDLKLNTPTQSQLSPQQRQYSQFIGGQPTQPIAPPDQAQPSIQTSALPTSVTNPTVRPVSQSSKTPKKKKAQFTPALLPGQSTLGQL